MKIVPKSQHTQRGAVLVVSLILLLVITLIAVSSMQGTVMEEKMAGNNLDRNLAFQAAESAIREVEMSIDGLASMGSFNGSGGFYGLTDDEPYAAVDSTWTDATKHAVASEKYGSYSEPKFFAKHFTTVVGTEGALNMSGYGDNKGSGDVTIFKITARGTGGNADSAEVILRTYFGRIF